MKTKSAWSSCLLAFAVCAAALPATAQAPGQGSLYTNIGSGSIVYNCCSGWTVSGTGILGTSFTAANEFAPGISGNVTDIFLAVGYVSGVNSFYVAIDADNSGQPGAQLAYFANLSSNQDFGGCCGLVDIKGVSGLHLTAGADYWMVVGPMDTASTTWEAWNFSNNAMGYDAYSTDGGDTWISNGIQAQGAIDILGSYDGTTPEPSSIVLFGSGMLGLAGVLRRRLL